MFQHTGQRRNNTRTRRAQRMSKRHSPTKHIHLGGIQPQNLRISNPNHRERLVQLIEIHIFGRQSSMLKRLGNRQRRTGCEPLRRLRGITPSAHTRQKRQPILLSCLARDQQDGGGAVGEWRRVRGGNGAVLGDEGRLDGPQLAFVKLGSLVVGIHHTVRLTLPAGHRYGDDLVLEVARGVSCLRTLVRFDREVVLRLTRHLVLRCCVLGGNTHQVVVIYVRKPVLDHTVDYLRVTVGRAEALLREVVGRVGHRLHTAGDDDIRVAKGDALGGNLDG
ncbi:hypothetical protein BC938DRAFT_481040 [Jimgerdemannia flammicorona]|uniref:Uncharacterized protein n=1 Tax=Jimgerdemannia flammicorona TaxID=994334 RepID=A0A433QH37_9FUNG|nr:hypothetical protein BC938DRAFT_481040 [Jimgerdemannia flammicorona]